MTRTRVDVVDDLAAGPESGLRMMPPGFIAIRARSRVPPGRGARRCPSPLGEHPDEDVRRGGAAAAAPLRLAAVQNWWLPDQERNATAAVWAGLRVRRDSLRTG